MPGVRLNLSRSGPSVSLGPRGLHYTLGRKGTRATLGIPGSGLSWTQYKAYQSTDESPRAQSTPTGSEPGVTAAPEFNAPNVKRFESPIEELVAGSTSELAPILNSARKQLHIHFMVPILFGVLIVFAIAKDLQTLVPLFAIIGLIVWLVAFLFIRHRLTTSLKYELQDKQRQMFEQLTVAFHELKRSRCLWRIPMVRGQPDWKRNAGASSAVERTRISPSVGTPALIKSNLAFLRLPLGSKSLYFTPDVVLVIEGRAAAAIPYNDLEIVCRPRRFVEDARVPKDTELVGESWQYVNRDGTPDRRFRNNRKLPVCLYGEIDLTSSSGLNERIHCSRLGVANDFVAHAVAMRDTNLATPNLLGDRRSIVDAVQGGAGNEKVDLEAAFANESEKARSLALNHGKLWEFLLIEELLKSKLAALKAECVEFEKAIPTIPKRQVSGQEFMRWLADKLDQLLSIIANIKKWIEVEFIAAVDEPGVSGDPIKILRAVDALFEHCRGFLVFEIELSATEPPEKYKVLKADFGGITLSVADFVEQALDAWSRALEDVRRGSHQFRFQPTFDLPQIQKISAEVKRHPELYGTFGRGAFPA